MARADEPHVAWHGGAFGLDSLVFAIDRAGAKMRVLESMRDANYRVRWIDIRVRRWPEYDHAADWAAESGNLYRCLDPELVEEALVRDGFERAGEE